MKWPWISRRRGAEQLARELQRNSAELQRITASADARVLAVTQERDWLRARNEQLTDVIVSFKRDGFGVPTRGQIKQPVDVDARVLDRVQGGLTAAFIDNAKRDMVNAGVSPVEAEREARRLREEAVSEHPASG